MTRTEARELVAQLAQAASNLKREWGPHASTHPPDDIDALLTRTYPEVITMSFDEFAAELWAWHERLGCDNHFVGTEHLRCLDCGGTK